MDKKEALEILKQCLEKIPHLKDLQFDNRAYQLWRDKVEQIVKSVLGPDDLKTLWSTNLLVPVIDYLTPKEVRQNFYAERLDEYGVNIEKIIQKYELLGMEEKHAATVKVEIPKAFISHGKESAALRKLKEFLETLGIEPLIVKKQATLGEDLPDKVNLYLSQADFVVILATGDDEIEGKLYPRQNVIYEIGLAQKTHPSRIIYLLEEGTEFPSNIRPKVWESFKQRNMMDAFLGIVRELRAHGMLKLIKPPLKEQT